MTNLLNSEIKMKKNYTLLFFATISLILSLLWGLSKNQIFEPWTAFVSGISYILGIYYSLDENKQIKIRQIILFSSKTDSKIKGAKNLNGEITQMTVGGKNNKQSIE